MRSLQSFLSYVVVSFSLVGCSSAFDRDWYQYVPTRTEDPLVGRWKGFWKSARTQHQGDLRCIIVRRAEGRYDARYHATYGNWLTFKFEYSVPMKARSVGDVWKLEGSEDLGWVAGGVYHYRGEIEGDEFKCRYSADEDGGVFELIRYEGDESSPP